MRSRGTFARSLPGDQPVPDRVDEVRVRRVGGDRLLVVEHTSALCPRITTNGSLQVGAVRRPARQESVVEVLGGERRRDVVERQAQLVGDLPLGPRLTQSPSAADSALLAAGPPQQTWTFGIGTSAKAFPVRSRSPRARAPRSTSGLRRLTRLLVFVGLTSIQGSTSLIGYTAPDCEIASSRCSQRTGSTPDACTSGPLVVVLVRQPDGSRRRARRGRRDLEAMHVSLLGRYFLPSLWLAVYSRISEPPTRLGSPRWHSSSATSTRTKAALQVRGAHARRLLRHRRAGDRLLRALRPVLRPRARRVPPASRADIGAAQPAMSS